MRHLVFLEVDSPDDGSPEEWDWERLLGQMDVSAKVLNVIYLRHDAVIARIDTRIESPTGGMYMYTWPPFKMAEYLKTLKEK